MKSPERKLRTDPDSASGLPRGNPAELWSMDWGGPRVLLLSERLDKITNLSIRVC